MNHHDPRASSYNYETHMRYGGIGYSFCRHVKCTMVKKPPEIWVTNAKQGCSQVLRFQAIKKKSKIKNQKAYTKN